MPENLLIASTASPASLEFSEPEPDSGPVESFVATLTLEGLKASIRINAWPPEELAHLFDNLAKDWKKWSGARSWESIEGEIRISCTTDHEGQVYLAISLHPMFSPGDWTASGVIAIEADQLPVIAQALKRFLRF